MKIRPFCYTKTLVTNSNLRCVNSMK